MGRTFTRGYSMELEILNLKFFWFSRIIIIMIQAWESYIDSVMVVSPEPGHFRPLANPHE